MRKILGLALFCVFAVVTLIAAGLFYACVLVDRSYDEPSDPA